MTDEDHAMSCPPVPNEVVDFSKPWKDGKFEIGKPEFVGAFPVRVDLTVLEPKERRLAPGWMAWNCPATGHCWLYKGRKPREVLRHIKDCKHCSKEADAKPRRHKGASGG